MHIQVSLSEKKNQRSVVDWKRLTKMYLNETHWNTCISLPLYPSNDRFVQTYEFFGHKRLRGNPNAQEEAKMKTLDKRSIILHSSMKPGANDADAIQGSMQF